MHVAIAIVSYKSVNDIVNCFAALEGARYEDFEVIVCENGGPEAFRDLKSALPGRLARGQPVRLIEAPHNLGYAGGVNLGLRETSDADAWWILNPDTEPSPEALTELEKRLSLGDCDAVGGPVLSFAGAVITYGGHWNGWLARARSLGLGEAFDPGVNRAEIERRQNYLCGASILAGRRFVEAAGPLREDYFLYCEETEWCLRALRKGLRLGFAPGGRVFHRQGAATGNVLSIKDRPRLPVYLDARNKLLLTRDLFAMKLTVAACASLLVLMLRYGRRGAWRQLRDGLAGWWAGLRNERGIPSWFDGKA